MHRPKGNGKIREEVQTEQGFIDFKEITDEELEQWAGFMSTRLHEFLAKWYNNRREYTKLVMISPSALKSECARLGVDPSYFQGIYSEACTYDLIFSTMRQEHERRVSRKHAPTASAPSQQRAGGPVQGGGQGTGGSFAQGNSPFSRG
jgi:hypothetical protein